MLLAPADGAHGMRSGYRHRRPARRSATVLLFLAVALAPAATGAARRDGEATAGARAPLAGLPLAAALERLRDEGLTLVFTSELVRPDMVVAQEPPQGSDPRRLLDVVLAPHGLAVEEGPGGVLVVVARSAPAAVELPGAVLALGSRTPLAHAVVRVVGGEEEAVAGPAGEFVLRLPPGRYTLEATAVGYLEQRAPDVEVAAGRPVTLELLLSPRPFVEDEIVVRPSRLSLLQEQPDAPFSLGKEEIARLPHLGGDVFRATSLLPGTASNDVSARFAVHGGRRDEVRILLDGQELYEAFHLADYDQALSVVPAHALAGATLATGGYPASQGDRMSGVLDLRTVEPQPGRHLLLGASVVDAVVAGSGTFDAEGGRWLASGRIGATDLAREVLADEDPSFWDLLGKVERDTSRGLFAVRALTAEDELAVTKVDEEDVETIRNDYRATYGWGSHETLVGGRALVESSLSWAQLERRRRGAGSEEDGSYLLLDERSTAVFGLDHSWGLQLGPRHLPRFGLEARRYDSRLDYAKALDLEIAVEAPFAPPRQTAHAFDDTVEGDHLGLWASDRVGLGGRATAEVGLRYDRHTATDDTLWSPRLNLARRLGERAVLRAAWGRFFQSQRPYELQVEDGEDALFAAELTEHWILGWEALPAARPLGLDAVRLELFGREVEDPRPRYENLLEPLNVFQEIEPDRVRVTPQSSRARGVELLLRGRGGERLGWWLAYSWSRAEDRIDGRWVPRSLDQPHAVTADLDWRLPRGWHMNLAWRYHSGWPRTPVTSELRGDPDDPEGEPELVAVFGELNGERLPAYHRLDLRVSRRWAVRRGHLTAFLDVQNLYDRENLSGFDLAVDEGPDGEEVLLLEDEHWPGIFPSLGLTWEL